MWQWRIEKDILAAQIPLKEQRILTPHHAPQPRLPVPGTGVLTTFGCENQWGFHPGDTEGCWTPSCPLMDSSTDVALSSSKGKKQQRKKHRRHTGRNWIIWLLDEDWRGSYLQDRSASRFRCSFVEAFPPSSLWVQKIAKSESPSTFPENPPLSTHTHARTFFTRCSSKAMTSAHNADFPKIYQRVTSRKQSASGLCMLHAYY